MLKLHVRVTPLGTLGKVRLYDVKFTLTSYATWYARESPVLCYICNYELRHLVRSGRSGYRMSKLHVRVTPLGTLGKVRLYDVKFTITSYATWYARGGPVQKCRSAYTNSIAQCYLCYCS